MEMKKRYDVVALGELLIDFYESDVRKEHMPMYEVQPGGAPCNVLAMLSKLGYHTCFIGKVGNDIFGDLLIETLQSKSIDISSIKRDLVTPTTLAMIYKLKNGDRDFCFYRNPGADMMLCKNDINRNIIEETKIFHFGSLSMTNTTNYEATIWALEIAKQARCMISFDPNVRLKLWENEELAKKRIFEGMSYCHVFKISDDEIEWLTGYSDHDEAIQYIRSRYDIPLILVSMGNKGSRAWFKYYDKEFIVQASPFLRNDSIEMTGAGDTFCGCVLHGILRHGLEGIHETNLEEILNFANAAASIITTRKGALCVMPSFEEVQEIVFTR